MKSILKYISIVAVSIIMFSACKKNKVTDPSNPPAPQNEGEVITTVKLTLTDSANAGNVFTALFNDPDGDGGNAATQFDTIKIAKGKTYNVKLELLDRTKNPEDTISNEVEDEANDHQLFFHFAGTTVANIALTYLDQDSNSPALPLGLQTKWRIPNSVAAGTAQIILKHQPGVKDGTETPGDTDVDLIFQVKLQ